MSRTYSMRARMLKIYMRIVSMGWDGMEKREKERGEKHHSEIEKSNMNVTICMHYFYDWCELNNIKICKNTHRRAEPSQNAFPVTTTQHNTKPSHRTSSHAQEKKEKKKKTSWDFPSPKGGRYNIARKYTLTICPMRIPRSRFASLIELLEAIARTDYHPN